MAENPYLMDEKNIPPNWSPVETPGRAPVGAPAPPVPHDMPQFFSGSMPPSLQHDTSFVGTEVGTPRIPKYSLMPLGNQADPFKNAAAQSTVISGGVTPAPVVPDVESISVNKQTVTDYTVVLGDLDTLITFDNNSGGVITLPGPTSGSFAFVQEISFFASAQSASTVITNGQGNLMILMATISDGGSSVPTVVDSNGNTWTFIAVQPDGGNIPTSFFYAFNIKGGANTITVTNPSSSVFCLPTVLEYSGFGLSDPLDAFAIHEDTSSTVTTGANDCLVYSGIRFPGVSNPAPIAGFTARFSNVNVLIQDQFVPIIGTPVIGNSIPPVTSGGGAINFIGSFKTSVGPSSALFPLGWFTYIQNTGTGTFMLTSKAQIDNSLNTVLIGPGQGLLLVWDGFNWFTDRGMGLSASSLFYQIIQSAGVDKPQEHKLNFLSGFTVTDNPGNNSTDIGLTTTPAAVEINGLGVSLDKQFFINGVFDGATIWGVSINGVPDGG